MKALKNFLHNQEKHFVSGGKYEKFYALYEAIDTFIFTPSDVTKNDAHVRDSIDLKRVMITVAWALTPILLFAMYNTGLQANIGLANLGAEASGWRADLLRALGLGVISVWEQRP